MPFMIWPLSICRGIFILAFFIRNALPYAILASVSQFLGSLNGPPYAAIINDIYPIEKRGLLMSYARFIMLSSTLVCTLVAGKLLSVMGYRVLFPLTAVVGWRPRGFSTIKTSPVIAGRG